MKNETVLQHLLVVI